MAKALISDEDVRSFLLPCIGFSNRDEANNYLAATKCSSRSDIEVLMTGRNVYVPNHLGDVDACCLTDSHWARKPVWNTLRRKDTPKPSESYNVALLVAGRRSFLLDTPNSGARHPKWWYELSTGWRDCYTVWTRIDGTPFNMSVDENDIAEVCAARSGKGVIYARTIVYANDGSVDRIIVRRLGLEFTILDRDPAKDDMMRITFTDRSTSFYRDMSDLRAHEDEVMNGDSAVWHQAIEGFMHTCNMVPPEVDEWRTFFLDQHAKEEADRLLFSKSFADKVEKMDWQDALRLVQEPWQMAVVCRKHGRRGEFSSDGGVYTIPYETVPTMIRRHDCTEERRQELRKMVDDYVEPTDNLWNYRGD